MFDDDTQTPIQMLCSILCLHSFYMILHVKINNFAVFVASPGGQICVSTSYHQSSSIVDSSYYLSIPI